jgi:hypothetical protein
MSTAGWSAAKWLARQDERAVRIAREIISRREALRQLPHREDSETTRLLDDGFIGGLRLALSYLGDRPGDISQTGAEGFIASVEHADELIAEDSTAASPSLSP